MLRIVRKNNFIELTIILYVLFISCYSPVNSGETKTITDSSKNFIEQKDTGRNIITAMDIQLDSVEGLDLAKEKQPSYINSRIKKLSNSVVTKWCREAGFKKLPDYILFRVFKQERQFEIWGREGNDGSLKLINTVEVCAIESEPGPKLKGWDYNTAEGFYTYNIYYTSPSWYMFVKLSNEELSNCGAYDYGSCFKMCINYPNDLDLVNSSKMYGKHNNIGTICIHGNCVTACCVSFQNEVWIVVFAFGLLHNIEYGLPHIYLFPCRFDKTDVKELFKTKSNYSLKDSNILYPFWENLKDGYFRFEQEHKPLKFKALKNGYVFE